MDTGRLPLGAGGLDTRPPRNGEIFDLAQWLIRAWRCSTICARLGHVPYLASEFLSRIWRHRICRHRAVGHAGGRFMRIDQSGRGFDRDRKDAPGAGPRQRPDGDDPHRRGDHRSHQPFQAERRADPALSHVDTRDVVSAAAFIWDAARMNSSAQDRPGAVRLSRWKALWRAAGAVPPEQLKHAVENFSRRWRSIPGRSPPVWRAD